MIERTRQRNIPDWLNQSSSLRYISRTRKPATAPWVVSSDTTTWRVRFSGYPVGLEVTRDENHPVWRSQDKPTALDGDFGGDFYNRKHAVTVSDGKRRRAVGIIVTSAIDGRQTQGEFHGPFYSTRPATIPLPDISLSDLNEMGATAIARCKPTNSVANVSVSLGEILFQGLPKLFGASLWKDRTLAAKASNEYLNAEFGWKPLTSDIKDVAYAAANSDRILSQYEKNAGQVVRRRYAFPVEVTEEDVLIGPSNGDTNSPGWFTNSLTDSSRPMPNLRRKTITKRSVWFSGAFTYHLPAGYNSRIGLVSAAAKAQNLLGLEFTPETVWNLAPWSWAIDWFSNAGDVVSNLSDWSTDGLVMKYGYIMEHVVRDDIYYLDGPSQFRFDRGRIPATVTVHQEVKRREAASPFGFGVTWEQFTPRQLAITAALGITRVFR